MAAPIDNHNFSSDMLDSERWEFYSVLMVEKTVCRCFLSILMMILLHNMADND